MNVLICRPIIKGLETMKAKDIMTLNVATVRSSATVAEAVKLMRFKQLRSLIVEPRTSDDAYGIVTETDIGAKVIALGKDPKEVRIYEIMSKPCIVVNPDLDVEYVARLFSSTGVWRAPVIQGEILGVISITDIITKSNIFDKPKLTHLLAELKKAISKARSTSSSKGMESKESVEAWDLVDEIEAEACFHGAPKPEISAREQFNQEKEEELVSTN